MAESKIREIRARAEAENRPMTSWEDQQALNYDWSAMRARLAASWLKQIDAFRRKAKNDRLNWYEIKMLKLFAKNRFPGAQELLQKHAHKALSRAETERGLRKSCLKTIVVQDEHGVELYSAVFDLFDRKAVAKHEAAILKRYGTSFTVKHEGEKTIVLLHREKSPQDGLTSHENNLPAVCPRAAKSFRTEKDSLTTPRELGDEEGKDTHAFNI